jgi:hypothetical protein
MSAYMEPPPMITDSAHTFMHMLAKVQIPAIAVCAFGLAVACIYRFFRGK